MFHYDIPADLRKKFLAVIRQYEVDYQKVRLTRSFLGQICDLFRSWIGYGETSDSNTVSSDHCMLTILGLGMRGTPELLGRALYPELLKAIFDQHISMEQVKAKLGGTGQWFTSRSMGSVERHYRKNEKLSTKLVAKKAGA